MYQANAAVLALLSLLTRMGSVVRDRDSGRMAAWKTSCDRGRAVLCCSVSSRRDLLHLRWMDPDGSSESVSKPPSALNRFPLLASSILITPPSLLLTSHPTLHLLLPKSFFFRSASNFPVPFVFIPRASLCSLFFWGCFFFGISLPYLLAVPLWAQRYCREGRERVRQLAGSITCYLGSEDIWLRCIHTAPAYLTADFDAEPSPLAGMCSACSLRGISLAVNAGLFQTLSNALLSVG